MSAKTYKSLADGILVLHICWTFLLFGGAIYMLFVPSYALTQIIVLSFTLLASLPLKGLCPLTFLENNLRKKIDPSFENHRSYITMYINKICGTNFRTWTVHTTIGVLYVLCYTYAILALVRGS